MLIQDLVRRPLDPLAVRKLCDDHMPTDWLEWDREALQIFFVRRGVAVPELFLDQVEAVQTVLLTEYPWNAFQAFLPVVQAFTGIRPNFSYLDEPRIAQVAVAVEEMTLLSSDGREYSTEVVAFIAALAKNQGVVYLPPPLDFAQWLVTPGYYRCSSCGHEDIVDDGDDGLCDVCSQRFNKPKAFDFKPSDIGLVRASLGVGSNLTYFMKADPVSIHQDVERILRGELDEGDLTGYTKELVSQSLLIVEAVEEASKIRKDDLDDVATATW